MEIELINGTAISEAMQEQVSDLYRQLNADIQQIPLKKVLAGANNVVVALCKEETVICGIALMATYKVISGHRGMIEDVVVDTKHRQKGIGRKLMEKLLEEGQHQGLDEIFLFTGHHREAAINLYKSLGFNLRNSGLYNLRLT